MAHDHHDHSNCSHDHGHSHGPHGDAKKAAAVSDEISQRQQAADKLAKSLAHLQEIATEHQKTVKSKTSAEPVKKEDVDLLIKEMMLTKVEAESALRSHKCDVIATLTYLINH